MQRVVAKQNQAHGGVTSVRAKLSGTKTIGGTVSSVAFTPVQGIEIINPTPAQPQQKPSSSSYFNSASNFMKVQTPLPKWYSVLSMLFMWDKVVVLELMSMRLGRQFWIAHWKYWKGKLRSIFSNKKMLKGIFGLFVAHLRDFLQTIKRWLIKEARSRFESLCFYFVLPQTP